MVRMILVLSLNSAVDKTYRIPGFRLGRMHRPGSVVSIPGGKGINVARVLKRAGEPVKLLGCAAGTNGRFIRERVEAEGIAAEWIEVEGESRLCLAVVSAKRGHPTEINEPGPVFKTADVEKVRRRLSDLLPRVEVLVCSGSLPRGVPADTYEQVIREAHKHGVATALDTSGPALAAGLKAGPRLVKPNQAELRELLNGRSGGSLRRQLDRLMGRGVGSAVVTLGARGLVAAERRLGTYWRVTPPRLPMVSPIGCGDTLLAGLVLGWRKGWELERSLREAAAMAAANALGFGAGVFREQDRRRILPKIRLQRL